MMSSRKHGDQPTTSAHPAPERSRVPLWALWFGIFGGPAAWSLQTLANLPVAAHGCFPRLAPLESPVLSIRSVAFSVSMSTVVVCVAAGVVSMRAWLRTRAEHHDATGKGSAHIPAASLLETGEGRTRFMALSGVLASALFLVAALVNAAALFLVTPCAS